MAIFIYEAITLEGAKLSGKMEANCKSHVINALREKNYFPITIEELHFGRELHLFTSSKLSLKNLAILCKQLEIVLTSGIGVLKGLEILAKQAVNNKLKKLINNLLEELQKGKSLSDSMSQYKEFPHLLINMTRAGEASGRLDIIMHSMALFYEKEYKLREKIKSAMTYPIVVCVFAIFVVVILVVKVLPNFINMIIQSGGNLDDLPLPTKIVITINNILSSYSWWILFGLLIFSVAIYCFFITKKGIEIKDNFKLKLPLIGNITSQLLVGRFARTLGMLMEGGVSIMDSLKICTEVLDNTIFCKILEASIEDIGRGRGISDTLENSKIFPKLLLQMIKIGEETGTLNRALDKTAMYYDGEAENLSTRLVTLIEPLIIIILSMIVGFIILSIILPIYEIYNTMGV